MNKIIKNILNIGTNLENDPVSINLYRKVNGISLSIPIILAIGALTVVLLGLSIIYFLWLATIAILFLCTFYFTSKNRINFACKYLLFLAELNVFLLAMFILSQIGPNVYYIEMLPLFILYPVFAALLNRSVLLHLLIALFFIALLYLLMFLFPQIPAYLFDHYNIGNIFHARLIGIIELLVIVGFVIHVFCRENRITMKKLKDYEVDLEHNMQKLKHSNKELEHFAYIASHDLQEPLRMVSSYLSLIKKQNEDKLDANSLEFLHFAVDGAHRMQKLINGLLLYSRANTKNLSLKQIDCECILHLALKNLEVVIVEKNAKITYSELPAIFADESQLIQLFQNLIANALKFCKNPTPEIHISAKQSDNKWLLGFHDNGIGIEQKDIDNIFKLFTRVHSASEYPGSGIGLSVCQNIVKRINGNIRLESDIGKGTTFWIEIPIKP